jgi:hypothetical protein
MAKKKTDKKKLTAKQKKFMLGNPTKIGVKQEESPFKGELEDDIKRKEAKHKTAKEPNPVKEPKKKKKK